MRFSSRRHLAGCLLLIFTISTIQAQEKDPPSKQLPATTRPLATVAGLDNANIVSVSEAPGKAGEPPTRIFRYAFRGTYTAVVKAFQQKLLKKDGWNLARVDTHEIDFWRDLPNGKIAMQGVLVFEARLQKNKWSPTGWSPLPPNRSRGWVWVSYNERRR